VRNRVLEHHLATEELEDGTVTAGIRSTLESDTLPDDGRHVRRVQEAAVDGTELEDNIAGAVRLDRQRAELLVPGDVAVARSGRETSVTSLVILAVDDCMGAKEQVSARGAGSR